MRYGSPLLIGLVLCTIVAVPAFVTVALGEELANKTNIEVVRELYEHVNNTRPSVVNAKENTELIRERLECYAVHDDYTSRIHICNNAYVKAIVKLSRATIKARPSLGLFVVNLNMCPVMYNMCVGQTGNDAERCVLFERQCIDFTLDEYWRGAAQYSQQQYRAE